MADWQGAGVEHPGVGRASGEAQQLMRRGIVRPAGRRPGTGEGGSAEH